MAYKQELSKALSLLGLKKYLNKNQEKGVEIVYDGRRDMFISGPGKSLCYKLPILTKKKSFIVVIASSVERIKKNNQQLKSRNIRSLYLTSQSSRNNRMTIENEILDKASPLKILFITPLQYESAFFKTILNQINAYRLSYIVIDQAETILKENMRRIFENLDLKMVSVPIIALSDIADSQARTDIIKKLGLRNAIIHAITEELIANSITDHDKNFQDNRIKNTSHKIINRSKSKEEKSSERTVSTAHQNCKTDGREKSSAKDISGSIKNDNIDKKAKALLALDNIYKNLYSKQKVTSAPTESSSTSKVSVKRSKRNLETITKAVQVITIDDSSDESEEKMVNSVDSDDDIIILKDLKRPRESPHCSSQQRKRRKL